MRFLVLAADIAGRERYLMEELPTVVDDAPLPLPTDPDAAYAAPFDDASGDAAPLPPAIVDELTTRPEPPKSDSVVPVDPKTIPHKELEPEEPPTVRRAVALMLSLLREEAPDPLAVFSPTQRPLVACLHRALRKCCAPYAEKCVVAPVPFPSAAAAGDVQDELAAANAAASAFNADGSPPEDLEDELVCVQWRACEPSAVASASEECLRTKVEAFMLLNKSVRFPKFSSNREINNVQPVSIDEVS